uniref:DUF4456 domain-containing protein n=1 Tax=Caenorhabditis tropicalis TaxID=1561998 RepID=A0A1I7UFC9_9PELO
MDQFKNLTEVKTQFFIDENSTDEKKKELAERTLTRLKADEFKELEEKLAQLKKQTDMVLAFIEKPISVDLDQIENHQKSLESSGFLEVYTCLEGVETNGTSIRGILEAIQTSRNFTDSPKIKKTLNEIVKSRYSMENARKEAAKLKEVTEKEFVSLKSSFWISDEFSGKLGRTVERMSKIQKLLDRDKETEPITDTRLVDSQIHRLSQTHQNRIRENRSQIYRVFFQIAALNWHIFTQESKLEIFNNDGSLNYKKTIKFFGEVEKVKGLVIDKKILREGLEKLQKMNSSAFDSTMKAVKALETLDLYFDTDMIGVMQPLYAVDRFRESYVNFMLPREEPEFYPAMPPAIMTTVTPTTSTSSPTTSWIIG